MGHRGRLQRSPASIADDRVVAETERQRNLADPGRCRFVSSLLQASGRLEERFLRLTVRTMTAGK